MNHQQLMVTYFVTMLAITNPFGNLGFFIALTSDKTISDQRLTAVKTGFACMVIFLVVTWFGDTLLGWLGITVPAFQMAGGIVIMLIGLKMLHSKRSDTSTQEEREAAARASVAVVPLAMPIIAGPGSISTILVDLHQFSSITAKLWVSAENILLSIVIMIVLLFAAPIRKFLGAAGIGILVKIMGLILIAMAMQMFTKGVIQLLPGLSA
jgi:multiple antibiotic resistance protein